VLSGFRRKEQDRAAGWFLLAIDVESRHASRFVQINVIGAGLQWCSRAKADRRLPDITEKARNTPAANRFPQPIRVRAKRNPNFALGL
jgi:hypothetical protein